MSIVETPYYSIVPKGFMENLEFRKGLLRLVSDETGRVNYLKAQELWIMCSRDILFYVNAFVWTYDPRKNPPNLPFITYEYQDKTILEILEAILRGKDKVAAKSRDMGMTWMVLIAYEWLWHFRDLQSFLLMSRKEDLVDKTEDPDCLMWKIDFIHKNLPGWLLPGITRTKLHLYNRTNGSVIDGSSTTADTGRGGRRTSVFPDEFASIEEGYAVLSATRDMTNCRLFTSTFKGVGNAFYDLTLSQTIGQIRLHWTLHPEKSKGLYYDTNGKPRSPWYDEQCDRAVSLVEIAQELDMDPQGSGYQYFNSVILDNIRKEQCSLPFHQGEIEYDSVTLEPMEFLEIEKGRLRLWTHLDASGKPFNDRNYVLGVDISAGVSNASNSVISIGDSVTKEKVGEFAVTGVLPSELAKIAVALARFFRGPGGGAFIIWEANGPGREFGNTVVESGYRNIYYRQAEGKVTKRTSDVPGWFSTRDTKLILFGEYRQALGTEFINRSLEAVKECLDYVYVQGTVAHARSVSSVDPTGAKDNHGDRVVADALLWRGLKIVKNFPQLREEKTVQPGSFMSRRREREAISAREMAEV